MSIRKDALSWFERNVGPAGGKQIFSSKIFKPDQSATKRHAWWIQIPEDRIRRNEFSHFYLLCQTAPDVLEFHLLKVPREYFLQNLLEFGSMGDEKISLFLSAEQDNLFEDERGFGNVNFSSFLIALQ